MDSKIMVDATYDGWRWGFPKKLPHWIDVNDENAVSFWMVSEGYPVQAAILWSQVKGAIPYRWWEVEKQNV